MKSILIMLLIVFLYSTNLYSESILHNDINSTDEYIKYYIQCNTTTINECNKYINYTDRVYLLRIAKLKSYKSWLHILYKGSIPLYIHNIKINKYKIIYLLCNSYNGNVASNDFGSMIIVKRRNK